MGPSVFGFISATHEVKILAEVGVVLLVFTIGIEFSMEGILRIKKYVVFGGAFHVLFTILISCLMLSVHLRL